MRINFNLAYQLDNDATGETERDIRADVYLDGLDANTFDCFKEGLMALCNCMNDSINES